MGRQTEVYRHMHPEQFSDSKVVKRGKMDRDFLDYYFETLTNKSLDKQFEDFCRHIAENEICPNLLPQTGPTGGGDSKVDSETYPVSEEIAILWYVGEGNKAAYERWAFAISAKKDWKPKVKSDVAKIIKVNEEENRGYTKIFFMSNQYISDKKRAEIEDELRKKYNMDVRILDRTWLLDKIFGNHRNVEIVIKSFGLSDSFHDEIQVGERDYKRKKEYQEIENRLKDNDLKLSEKVFLVQRAVVLGRELEFSKSQILGCIDRSIRISKEYGMKIDLANAYYDAAWTTYWWYSDAKLYYEYYKEYENIALLEENSNVFNRLINLWINLYTLAFEEVDFQVKEHTEKIQERYKKYLNDQSKPNSAIEVKATYQSMRILLGEDIDDIVNEMIQILDDSFGHLDLDLYPLKRIIQEIPMIEDAKRYDELFEHMVSIMSSHQQKTEAAFMLASRGRSLKKKKPYEALVYFSRTLMSFFNQKDKEYLITVVMEMGEIFEQVGLLWAARNFYYFDFCLCLNQYMKFGEVSPWFFLSAHSLKYIELRLGHILYATEFDLLAKIAEKLYPQEIEKRERQEEDFDYILAIQILRTQYDIEKELGQLPFYLEKHGLVFSAMVMKYELGYYDEDILNSLNGNKGSFDDLISKWKEHPVLERLKYSPWYGKESSCKMQTKVLGCTIEVEIENCYDHGEIEIGATILATIESFLGTGITNQLISLTGKIVIEICFDSSYESLIRGEIVADRPNHIRVIFSEYDASNTIDAQKKFSDFTNDLLGMIILIMFPNGSGLRNIEKMIKNDAAFERSYTFANSVFYGMETLGKDTFTFDTILRDYENLTMQRTNKCGNSEIKNTKNVEEIVNPKKVHYNISKDKLNLENVSNEDIVTQSIINIPLWNISEWKGVMFISDPYSHSIPPVLSFVFAKETGKTVFEEWIKEIGTFDSKNEISICIIKGIDKAHPHWYRVIVGTVSFEGIENNKPKIVVQSSRVHTMTPENNTNLRRFENEMQRGIDYWLCPSIMPNQVQQPKIMSELAIRKKDKSIIICNACDVQENNLLAYGGIFPTDNPIIPIGREDAPILKMIARKRNTYKE
ncbi:hypothetical protein QTL86_01720 [Cellulosilyticum sp. ST5]|uniref:hypothetical protein n=1 Tax=Cellulosilyticum sp. ST5 TaxID=3055805 RepID=UPI00397730E0